MGLHAAHYIVHNISRSLTILCSPGHTADKSVLTVEKIMRKNTLKLNPKEFDIPHGVRTIDT